MKTLSKFVLVILLFTAIIACKNNTSTEADAETATDTTAQMLSETPTPAETKPGFATLSFKMDGTLVEGTVPSVMAIFVPAKKEVNIRGNTPKGLFAVIIDNVQGAGTYTIKGTSANGGGIMMTDKMYEVKKSGTPFIVTIDTVEDITAVSTPDAKAIRGTFEGKIMDDAGNTIMITEGKFSSQ
ncbi:MAG: hypothetical protein V7655_11060 [Aequorivita antarctica]